VLTVVVIFTVELVSVHILGLQMNASADFGHASLPWPST